MQPARLISVFLIALIYDSALAAPQQLTSLENRSDNLLKRGKLTQALKYAKQHESEILKTQGDKSEAYPLPLPGSLHDFGPPPAVQIRTRL